MLPRLGGRCWPMAVQLCRMAAPVCGQRSPAAMTWRPYRTPSPVILTLQRPSLLPRCGLHTSAALYKKRRHPQDEEFSEMLQSYRHELSKMPRAAGYLSLAGVVPVVVAPLTMTLGGYYYPEMAFLQLAAANCLLSFYGGIRWGMSFPQSSDLRPDALNLGLGALLPLIAWTSLVLSDDLSVSALIVIGGMIAGVFGGVGMLPPFPVWLGFLRNACFLVTFASIVITLWLSAVYPKKSLKEQSPK